MASSSVRNAEALDWIGRAVTAGCAALQIPNEPDFANLRKDPVSDGK